MRLFLALAMKLSLILIISNGCVKYVEQETPAGQVAQPITQSMLRPYRPAESLPESNQSSLHFNKVENEVTNRNNYSVAEALTSLNDSILSTFSHLYQMEGRPRMAVFLNRTLSDEVREWHTAQRRVLSFSDSITHETADHKSTIHGPGGISAYSQRYIEEQDREVPEDEGWMWAFEDGFLGAFLDAGAQIVDRATIIRLAAADSGQQGNAFHPMSIKKIEIDALRGKADVFVEILIHHSPDSNLGYDFKVSAKDVKTGIIQANISTRGWNYESLIRKEKVVATETGYEFVEEVESQMPDVKILSRNVALALMQALNRAWSR